MKKTKIRCGACNSVNLVALKDIAHKLDGGKPKPRILCWKCCRKKNFYNKPTCSICGDLPVCQGKFKQECKDALDNELGGV